MPIMSTFSAPESSEAASATQKLNFNAERRKMQSFFGMELNENLWKLSNAFKPQLSREPLDKFSPVNQAVAFNPIRKTIRARFHIWRQDREIH
jgi:hypothetical protein